jgi:hypothetical protein
MRIEEIMKKMIDQTGGNHHDINHLMKVHSFARIIGLMEGLDEETQYVLEASAIVHDIACPLCREKYGSTAGNLQEAESEPLLRAFFRDTNLPEKQLERIIFIVTHHHTYNSVDGPDYQILLEADFLVNADESERYRKGIEQFRKNVFRTASGLALLNSVFCKELSDSV